MSSQLNVDTIVDKAGSGGTNVKIGNTSTYVADGGSASQNTVQSLVKAWCTVDENSTLAVRDSFNNNSVTDNSTSNTSFTMTNAFNNTDFSLMAFASQEGSSTSYDFCYEDSSARTTSVVKVESRNYTNGNLYDDEYKMIQIAGDLA